MTKTLLSLVAAIAVSTSLSASDTIIGDNQSFCKKIEESMPGLFKIGTDLFSIMDGKDSTCEQHSQEEWKNLFQSAEQGFMLGLNYSLPNLYSYVVEKAKESKTSDIEGLKKITQEVAESGKFALSATQYKDGVTK